MGISSRIVDSFHEAGHIVFADLLGVHCRHVTLNPPSHCSFTIIGVLRLMLDEDKRAIIFIAGITTQKYFFPNEPITSTNDQSVLFGLSERRKTKYISMINQHLDDPEIRSGIEQLSKALITNTVLNRKQGRIFWMQRTHPHRTNRNAEMSPDIVFLLVDRTYDGLYVNSQVQCVD